MVIMCAFLISFFILASVVFANSLITSTPSLSICVKYSEFYIATSPLNSVRVTTEHGHL